MKVLVTGATGFIGSHVARAFLRHGYEVRALVRWGGGRRQALLPDAVEVVAGDLTDRPSLAAACDGCAAVAHVAAMYELWAPKPVAFYEVNVAGTRALIEAAHKAGIERMVYTSSVCTIPPGSDERVFADPAKVHSHYKRSKILAERVALEAGWPVVVNPSTPVGWGDVRPTPTGRIVLDFLRGRMPAYVDTGLNLVDVEDVAEGHVLALERGEPGERYVLGGENLSLECMLEWLAEVSRRKPPRIRLPFAVAYAAGAASEVLQGRLLGTPPAVPFEGVRMARTPMYYDTSKAVRELGLPQSPIGCALRKAAEWFHSNGYC
ncbi:MAG: NAD-dependent epimerase/dehydratase family protein [Chloroflexi bacterium]|nr:NAD-dependent epimerase/dehydratase family protein [Chloroflexota bacterium]